RRAALPDLENGDGVEGRVPAASRIPHAADGLVRAAALADPVGGGRRQDRSRRRNAGRAQLAHPAEISRQSAYRRQGGADRARPRTHAGDARLYAGQDRGRRDRRSDRQAGGPQRARDRGHVSDHGDRQLRGPLRHSDRASRDQRRRLLPARLVRLFVRQRLLGWYDRSQFVRHAQKREDADGGCVMIKALKALSALLTYPTAELQQACGEISEAIEAELAVPLNVRDRLPKLLTEI